MEIDQLEALALEEDREKALSSLIPGTDDYYFHRALLLEQSGRLDELPPLLEQWRARHAWSDRLREIERRRALLLFDERPEETVQQLIDDLGVRFDHQRQVDSTERRHPSVLDQKLIARSELVARAFAKSRMDLAGFTDSALRWVGDEALTRAQRSNLLDRLDRPDHPRLVEWIIEDLDDPTTGAFGGRRIHGLLTLAQLEALRTQRPKLLEQHRFVLAWIDKLAPSPDVDWEQDPKEREAFLDRLWGFVKDLGPAFNDLKATVLHHRLDLDRRLRVYDRSRFLEYLALPRSVHYAEPKFLKKHEKELASLDASYPEHTLLPPVGDDETLVRELLQHFVLQDASVDAFAPYVKKEVLRRWRALAMIGAGIGDQERWYSELDDPSAYQRYRDRVDLELLPENPVCFSSDDPVQLAVRVKNVRDLVVKVYEINTKSYFMAHGREVDTSIDLDGLVAGEERTVRFDDSPLRVVRHEIELDSIVRPGTYVVELIGNGKSSRALIEKGTLRMVEREGAAGHVISVLDEKNQPLPEASIWFGGRELVADDSGEILIPYTTRPGPQKLLLCHGSLSTLETFVHKAERYRLAAGFFVDREQLVAGSTADLVVRAGLFLDDVEVGLEMLEEVRLTIQATNGDGTSSSTEVAGFTLSADREATHAFEVPENLRSLSFTIRAKVRSASEGKLIDLEAQDALSINGIDDTDHIADLFLSRTRAGFVMSLLGKTGEPIPSKSINVSLQARDFTEPVRVTLQTDDQGRIELGALDGIVRVSGTTPFGHTQRWEIEEARVTWPAAVHGKEGEPISLAYAGRARTGERDRMSLLERRGGTFLRDCLDHLFVEGGRLILKDLSAGDYELFLVEEGVLITVRVAAGEQRRGWVTSSRRQLEARPRPKLAVDRIEVAEDHVEVRLGAFSPSTRLHLFATRFVATEATLAAFGRVTAPEPRVVEQSRRLSQYVSGRDIGDEYRYILERRYQAQYPGNMLARPGLLLNPWSLRETGTGLDLGLAGAGYGAGPGSPKRKEKAKKRARADRTVRETGFSSVDFLSAPGVVLANLRPDEHGVVRVERAALGGCCQVRVVAVDRGIAMTAEVLLPEADASPRDRRLLRPLPAEQPFTQKKERTALSEGARLSVEDVATAEVECIDTLEKAYAVLSTLSHDRTIDRFAFAVDWPNLDEATRRRKYSEHACHELNLFLERKDPAFFLSVVKPYLANKKDKTFMDRYLLGEPLERYLEPWAYGRLNTLERILLGRRVDGEAEPAKRHVKERFDMIERDVEEEDRLFRSLLSKSALDTADTLGFGEAREEARAAKSAARSGAPPPPPAPASQPAPMEAADDEMEMALFDADMEELGEEEAYDIAKKDEIRPLYRQLNKTEEWAENNYYQRRIEEQDAVLIGVNAFWRDFAEHDGKGPFLSGNFAAATSCFAESMCALAVLDLPFDASDHEVTYEGGSMRLTAKSNAILLHREIKPAVPLERKIPILVSQSYFRKDDRYEWDGAEQREKYVTGEFLTHVVYACKVVLTNPTSTRERLDLLLQIPEGAIPVEGGFFTRGRPVVLESYATQAVEYAFYFPRPGRFTHYPVQVAKNEALVAAASSGGLLEVVDTPSSVDRSSWAWVSQHGTLEDVLEHLERHNVHRLDLERIAWRMRERDAFERVLALLTSRHRFDATLWSYALEHRDRARIGEYLRHREDFLRLCGVVLESPLVDIDPVARCWYQHLEYMPLVNARAHQLGGKTKILNDAFEQQYRSLLRLLCYRKALSASDRLAVAYYLFLQDRVEPALAMLARVKPEEVETKLQLDYLTSYASLYTGEISRAREIASAHRDHPVDRWRRLFEGVLAVLDEAEDQTARVLERDDRSQEQAKLAQSEPSFELSVADRTITVGYRNLTECQVSFYRMDIELLFSKQPFVQQDSDRFAVTRPGRSDRLELPADQVQVQIPLPEEFHRENVIVEVAAAGQRRALANYAHDLSVHAAEQYGHLYVREPATQAPVPKAYVKVYARTRGGVTKFYKDGYTDVRGCFDYTSLSTDELDGVDRFALLIMTEDRGAVIREARPPQR